MKVIIKPSYKTAEEKLYQIPKEERKNAIFWSCQDFLDGKEYEVISITPRGAIPRDSP